MIYHYFEGYFEEAKKLNSEKEKYLKLKDRSYCPCCDNKIDRQITDNTLEEIEELLENLEIRSRKYNIKINEEYFNSTKLLPH